jgi:hypothetical protein
VVETTSGAGVVETASVAGRVTAMLINRCPVTQACTLNEPAEIPALMSSDTRLATESETDPLKTTVAITAGGVVEVLVLLVVMDAVLDAVGLVVGELVGTAVGEVVCSVDGAATGACEFCACASAGAVLSALDPYPVICGKPSSTGKPDIDLSKRG